VPSHVAHLESALDGTRLEARTLQTTHKDRPLWVRYDLNAVGEALRESGGRAVAVDEARIRDWMRLAASTEGVSVGPEAAVCVGAAARGAEAGWIGPDDRVVIYNCGAAQKYPDVMARDLPHIDKDAPIDWERIAG